MIKIDWHGKFAPKEGDTFRIDKIRDGSKRGYWVWEISKIEYEPVQLEVLASTQINNAVADYRSVLEMNGHKPTVADGRIAVSHATITHNEKKLGQLYRIK